MPSLNAEYRFCFKCGHRLSLKVIDPTEPERLVCSACNATTYIDPKIAVGSIIIISGKIVLLKRGIEPGYGKWVFPGGYVNRGEVLEDAAVRETKEEANIDVEIESLLNAYSYPNEPVILIVYIAKMVGGKIMPRDETLEAKAFSFNRIPWDQLAFSSTRDALRDFLVRVRVL
ncbi:NUDIX hydrolase [bacterium]|nr:NUDIX hydrolase [bacterium]